MNELLESLAYPLRHHIATKAILAHATHGLAAGLEHASKLLFADVQLQERLDAKERRQTALSNELTDP